MKVKIAICDDEKHFLKKISNKVHEISEKLSYTPEICLFQSGKEIMEIISNGSEKFDIYLLDIDMPDISGLKVAKAIRESGLDAILIFISSHEHYVFEAIEYVPFRYIRKNKMDLELTRALQAAYESIRKNADKTIILKSDFGEVRLQQSDIIYFEVEDRKINIHVNNGKNLIVRKTVKQLYTDLNDDKFIKLHSGCVVNVKYVKEFSNFDVTLDDGKKLIMSRTRVKDVKTSLLDYWKGKQ